MILTITIAAGIGAVFRFWLSKLNGELPWGTLLANNLAVISIPVFTELSGDFKTSLIIGFAGSLSTVSSFALEITQLNRAFRVRYAFLTLASCLASYELFDYWF